MKLSDFDFDLPPDRIAQTPAIPRDSARLLHIGATLADHTIRDLPGLLRKGDLLIFNDTRVLKARLTGMRGAARVVSASQSGMVRAYAFWMVLGVSLAGIVIALIVAGGS